MEYGSSTAAVEALRQNVETIENVIQLMIDFQLRQMEDGAPQRKWYDTSRLAYSEMPICGVSFSQLVFSIVTPFGFESKRGHIEVTNRKWTNKTFHTGHSFFRNSSSNEVACLTAAQFVNFGVLPEHRGAKIVTLLSEAPSSVTQLSDDLCVVHGTIKDIEKELGFTYLP